MWEYLAVFLRCRLLNMAKNDPVWSIQCLSCCAHQWHHFLTLISVLDNIPHLLLKFQPLTLKKVMGVQSTSFRALKYSPQYTIFLSDGKPEGKNVGFTLSLVYNWHSFNIQSRCMESHNIMRMRMRLVNHSLMHTAQKGCGSPCQIQVQVFWLHFWHAQMAKGHLNIYLHGTQELEHNMHPQLW